MAKNNQTTLSKIISFPEKVNNIFLFLIVVLFFGIVVLLDACVLLPKDYNVEPNYEEELYSEWVNTHVRFFNSYVLNEDTGEISMNYRIQGAYYGKTNSNGFIDYRPIVTFVTNKGEVIYAGKDILNTSSTTLTTEYYTSNTNISNKDITKVYLKFEYTRYEDGKRTKEEYLTLKEDILDLSKKEIKMDVCNTFLDVSDVISTFDIRTKKETSQVTFVSSINLNASNKENYHVDLQIFGIDDENKAYDLMGYYNMQNCKSSYFTHETQVTNAINLEYIIVKCRVVNEVYGERIVYLKKAYSDLTAA